MELILVKFPVKNSATVHSRKEKKTVRKDKYNQFIYLFFLCAKNAQESCINRAPNTWTPPHQEKNRAKKKRTLT